MALLRFLGPLFTWRGFKQTTSRRLRATIVSKFENSYSEFAEQGYGNVVKLCVPRSPKETSFFIKSKPDAIPSDENLISVEEYGVRYSMACHSSKAQSMRIQLVSKSFVEKNLFE